MSIILYLIFSLRSFLQKRTFVKVLIFYYFIAFYKICVMKNLLSLFCSLLSYPAMQFLEDLTSHTVTPQAPLNNSEVDSGSVTFSWRP